MKMTGCWKENDGEDIGYTDIMQISLHPDVLTQTHFIYKGIYTHILHSNLFVQRQHRHFCLQTLFLYPQTPLHTNTFTVYRNMFFYTSRFYVQMLLHAKTIAHRNFYTQIQYSHCYTQAPLHTDALTHRRFLTQRLLHTEAFTHKGQSNIDHRCLCRTIPLQTKAFTKRRIYTKIFLRTDAFTTHRGVDVKCFYTPQHNHTFSSVFYYQNLISCWGTRCATR